MKLLDLNTHSLEEKNMEEKQQIFADTIEKLQPDVFCLQEVNQTFESGLVEHLPKNLVMVQDEIPLRKDNHAYQIARLLESKGLHYYWAWLPIKVGYSKYDEGLAVFSKKPILQTDNLLVSNTNDYSDYRTRRLLGIKTEDGWFYDAHMSWWKDPEEPFKGQWEKASKRFSEITDTPVVLMGDFNGDAAIRNENYDLIASDHFYDTYLLADNKDDGFTVSGAIDGWKDQDPKLARRIDQIWINQKKPVKSSKVIFNGLNLPIISDHFGILTEL